MSDGRGQEYLDENICLHEDVLVNDYTVTLQTKQQGIAGTSPVFESFDDTIVTSSSVEDFVTVEVWCPRCGDVQKRNISIEVMIDMLNLEWEE